MSIDSMYDAGFQLLIADGLVKRWGGIEIGVAVGTALTATGSAVSGWVFWSEPTGHLLWGVIAGVAALAAIFHGAARIPTRIKEQARLRREFGQLKSVFVLELKRK